MMSGLITNICMANKLGLFENKKVFLFTYQGPVAEVTVVQQPHQGTHPKMGCYHFRGSFFT